MHREDAFFLALLAVAFLWVAVCFSLLSRIKNHHPAVYEAWGSPTMTKISPEMFSGGTSLLLTADHKNWGDQALTLLIYALRIIGTIVVALLISFLYTLFLG